MRLSNDTDKNAGHISLWMITDSMVSTRTRRECWENVFSEMQGDVIAVDYMASRKVMR